MAAYFAMRCMDKEAEKGVGTPEGIQAAKDYYNAVFAIQAYQQFQADTDAILAAEGKAYLIPTQQ